VPRNVKNAYLYAPNLERGSLKEERGSSFCGVPVTPPLTTGTGEIETSASPIRELTGTRNEIGMDVGLGDM